MNPPPNADDHPADHLPPPDWVAISSYPSFAKADDHALVLLATGYDSWIVQDDEYGFRIFVPSPSAESAQAEIDAYESECATITPSVPESVPLAQEGRWVISVWLLSLVVVFLCQSADPSLTERGLSSSHAIFDQLEWWRPFTALFLHADLPHLAGNLLGGAIFGILLVGTIGPGPAILGILISGTLGNAINAFIYHPHEHRSLGASTAVFGTLGILSVCGFLELIHHHRALPWRRITAPLVAGLIVLGWMGGGSPGTPTDVPAHIAGFLCGLVFGATHSWLARKSTDPAPYLK